MSGRRFVADTNFLIDVYEGRSRVEPFLDAHVFISGITEIELLGWHNISEEVKLQLEQLIADCVVVDLNSEIKKIAIELRQKYKVKTPDAIIAATAKYLQLHLLTADRDFKKINDLELILLS